METERLILKVDLNKIIRMDSVLQLISLKPLKIIKTLMNFSKFLFKDFYKPIKCIPSTNIKIIFKMKWQIEWILNLVILKEDIKSPGVLQILPKNSK